MKILLTGSSGFVGKNILDHNDSKKYKILSPDSTDLDLMDINSVNNYLKKNKPDMIIHAAGYVGGIAKNQSNNIEFFYKNYIMGHNIIFSAYYNNIYKVLNISSSCFYSSEVSIPLNENLIGRGHLEKTNFGYALAKISTFQLCQYFNSLNSHIKYKTIVPTNLFGKFDTYKKNESHLIAAIIMKLDDLRLSEKAQNLEMWGTGKPLREFMFASDFSGIIFHCIKKFDKMPFVLNAGNGFNKSVLFYHKKIAEILKTKIIINANKSKPDGIRNKLLNSKSLKKFGWNKFTPFNEAIDITYKQYLKDKKFYWKLAENTWDFEEEMIFNTFSKKPKHTMGNVVQSFENIFAKKYKKKFGIMVNSGSSANLLMAESLKYHSKFNFKKGDEIIIPALSWSTSYFPFYQAGFKIKLVDIDLQTLNINLSKLSKAITKKTKAILAVNILGNSNNFAEIYKIISNKKILLLEDNCESLHSKFNKKFSGTFGIMGTFSFFYSHHISTIEGGMILTDDIELSHILRVLRAHGWTRDIPENSILLKKIKKYSDKIDFYKQYNSILPGYNLRPQELNAALGISQLKKVNNFIRIRRSNAKYFLSKIKKIPYILTQEEIGESSWFAFTLTLINFKNRIFSRDELAIFLNKYNIETRPVVMGNFAKTESAKFLNLQIHEKLKNADYIYKNSLYISNHSSDIKKKIDKLIKLLNFFFSRD